MEMKEETNVQTKFLETSSIIFKQKKIFFFLCTISMVSHPIQRLHVAPGEKLFVASMCAKSSSRSLCVSWMSRALMGTRRRREITKCRGARVSCPQIPLFLFLSFSVLLATSTRTRYNAICANVSILEISGKQKNRVFYPMIYSTFCLLLMRMQFPLPPLFWLFTHTWHWHQTKLDLLRPLNPRFPGGCT